MHTDLKAKRSPGRPRLSPKSPMQRINVTLDEPTMDRAREISGSNNLSAGIRKAVSQYKTQ